MILYLCRTTEVVCWNYRANTSVVFALVYIENGGLKWIIIKLLDNGKKTASDRNADWERYITWSGRRDLARLKNNPSL
ncbi:hypothetical protein SAMN02745217_01648 [Anaerocolumna xylanovorans DSM 12503]|uniref:Uncharacterized protein n=1 Tax=Anaerocolumna xylanovorans DSM 12503 TaxID=1121345 RepID=A0A1M7Y5I1_9FIRM|nr:hypothetical protein SAMN02745217_01648 [Anaerocolumna xylanovorans DSM 12503]